MQFDQMTKVKMKRRRSREEKEVQEGPQCVIYKEATPCACTRSLPVSLSHLSMQLNLALRMSEKKEKILIKILNCLQKFAQRCESSSGHGEVLKGGDRGTSVAGDKWKWKPKTQTDIGIVTSLVNPLTYAGSSV